MEIIQYVSVAIAFASFVVAGSALYLGIRNNQRAEEVARVQTFLEMRHNFLSIYAELGDFLSANAPNEEERRAREAYWHNAYNQWYVSKKLGAKVFDDLWDGFFRDATRSGYGTAGLRATLDKMVHDGGAGYAVRSAEFHDDIGIDPGQKHARDQ
ncbi:MAG: hypothetical protein AAGF94_12255 [Pseudomonadota bacterium]